MKKCGRRGLILIFRSQLNFRVGMINWRCFKNCWLLSVWGLIVFLMQWSCLSRWLWMNIIRILPHLRTTKFSNKLQTGLRWCSFCPQEPILWLTYKRLLRRIRWRKNSNICHLDKDKRTTRSRWSRRGANADIESCFKTAICLLHGWRLVPAHYSIAFLSRSSPSLRMVCRGTWRKDGNKFLKLPLLNVKARLFVHLYMCFPSSMLSCRKEKSMEKLDGMFLMILMSQISVFQWGFWKCIFLKLLKTMMKTFLGQVLDTWSERRCTEEESPTH